jgi:excisionase family DNA binding protein
MPPEPIIPLQYLSTAQVAAGLGVGVSTIKRWVEDGILPATKTAGGHRKLLLADVLAVAKRNNLPVHESALLGARATSKSPRDPSSRWKEFHRALVKGDLRSSRAAIHGAYQHGTPVETIADEIVQPAMQQIGKEWQAGVIDVMHEHRASQLCASVLTELKQWLETRAVRHRPVAVGGAPEGDHTVLATLLAQMVLLDAGWDAVNLGPSTPLKSLALAVRELRPKLVWLTISHQVVDAQFRRDYSTLYQLIQDSGASLVIGGRALTESIRASLPYTAYGDGLTHLAAFARSLHPQPRRPRPGRPPQN